MLLFTAKDADLPLILSQFAVFVCVVSICPCKFSLAMAHILFVTGILKLMRSEIGLIYYIDYEATNEIRK